MKLMLTPDFSPGFAKSLESGKVNLMEVDHSSVVGEAPQSATAIAEKVPDTIAELISNVQPVPCDFVEKLTEASQEIFENTKKHPNNFITATEGKVAEVVEAICSVQPMTAKPPENPIHVMCEDEGPCLKPCAAFPSEGNDNQPVPSKSTKKLVEKLVKANPELLTNPDGVDEINDPFPKASAAFKDLCDWAMAEGKDNQPVLCSPPRPSKPLAVTKVPVTDGNSSQPAPGWWLGDDFCWHPPLTKYQEKYALDLITALQPAVLGGPLPDPADAKSFISPYLPVYTTPPIIPVDLQKKMGISVGRHGTIGSGGKVEDLKMTGAWSVTGANPITKSAPCAPTSIDDATSGFKAGDVWYNAFEGILYRCASCAVGNAVWCTIGKVTPTPEGPKIILSGKPKHLVGLYQQEIDGMKKQVLSDHKDAEKDLVEALFEEIKEEIDKDIMANAYGISGGVIQKPPALSVAASDVEYMQKKVIEAMKIPKHLLVSKVHNSR